MLLSSSFAVERPGRGGGQRRWGKARERERQKKDIENVEWTKKESVVQVQTK